MSACNERGVLSETSPDSRVGRSDFLFFIFIFFDKFYMADKKKHKDDLTLFCYFARAETLCTETCFLFSDLFCENGE